MFLFNFSDSVCSRSTHNKPCCVCFCFLGGQWSRWRFQCEHGLYWRAGSAHEWCRVFSCIQVRHSYHFVTEWANSKCKFPVVLSVLEVTLKERLIPPVAAFEFELQRVTNHLLVAVEKFWRPPSCQAWFMLGMFITVHKYRHGVGADMYLSLTHF